MIRVAALGGSPGAVKREGPGLGMARPVYPQDGRVLGVKFHPLPLRLLAGAMAVEKRHGIVGLPAHVQRGFTPKPDCRQI